MLSEDLAGFLGGRVDIHLGTRDAGLRPHGARVSALRVEADRAHVLAFVPEHAASRVLPDLEHNGLAALVCGHPPTHRSYQLKGRFVGVRRAEDAERPFIEEYWASYRDALAFIGIPSQTFAHWPVWPSLAIRIRVESVFSQTPGPGAGAPVA